MDTLGTLFGHSGVCGSEGPGHTLSDTPSDTPVFGDTLGDTHSPKGPERLLQGCKLVKCCVWYRCVLMRKADKRGK